MIFRLLILLSFIFINFSSAINTLEKVSLNGNVLELKFKSSLKARDVHCLTLQNPKREIFDFENSQLGDNIGSVDANGMVKIAQNTSTKVRVVVSGDTSRDAKLVGNIYKIPLKIKNQAPKIEDKKEDKSQYNDFISIFSNIQKAPEIEEEQTKSSDDQKEEKNIPSNKKKEENKYNYVKSDKNIDESSIKGEVVVIDAGHGGKDPGAVNGNKQEKYVTLTVAKKLGKILANRGFKVYLTRDDDRFITLEQRTKIADRKDAKIFISLHCNAAPNDRLANSMHGIETFFLQRSKDARSQAIAARENAAVLQGADSKSKQVIVDAVLNGPKIVLSNKLAIDIQNNLLKNIATKNGGVRSAPFWVLVGASRPSVLVEMGYISHPEEKDSLFNDSYQNKLADGIADGIVRYLANQKAEIEF
ncbi:N-acetylmuramoyl-L-alanine amidase AmiA [Sulfurovum sp. enrichment culture clone C5]|uniref:N-acetylmuramoyl-L-alanine amidase n=1 Tax=Sulfurovum sp. enrichment culture clone C5 TaxID=497650 RepID=A0A0S4XNZ9_9BACT|nr:N-acetylmuramoyl-L-alanine amidase AmiA [Sulfurovum sp. enrichment culture clone C5]